MNNPYLSDSFFGRLETLSLNLRTDLRGYFGGKHKVSTYGQTVEFSDYREYQLGDDIRRIDWNLYSRFEKYFLKLFTDERQMKIQIFLDCSASMGKDNKAKSDYAVAAASAIGYLAVHNMDKVTFNLMKGNKADNPFGTIIGKSSYFTAVSEIEKTEFVGDVDIEKCIIDSPDQSTGNGLTVIISDFFTDSNWKKAVDYLIYKHRQVLLIQVMTPSEADPLYDGRVHLIDSESEVLEDNRNLKIKINRSLLNTYQLALNDYLNDIKAFSRKREIGFLSVLTDKPIEKVLFGEFLKAGVIA